MASRQWPQTPEAPGLQTPECPVPRAVGRGGEGSGCFLPVPWGSGCGELPIKLAGVGDPLLPGGVARPRSRRATPEGMLGCTESFWTGRRGSDCTWALGVPGVYPSPLSSWQAPMPQPGRPRGAALVTVCRRLLALMPALPPCLSPPPVSGLPFSSVVNDYSYLPR